MHDYGVRDVERLLGLSRNTLRSLVKARFVLPTRGPRNSWRFSFQDLIVLRTAKALVAANVPQRRITRALKELRRQLPESMPLSGLGISAVADRVVVREGSSRWQAESGQYLLDFEGDPKSGTLRVVERVPDAANDDADAWYEKGVALEHEDPARAVDSYLNAIRCDPELVDARINLGLLLHQERRHREAEQVYRLAIERCGDDALLWFNLGVLLEDMGRLADAAKAYESALAADPAFADGHFNLSLLCHKTGKPKEAIRHMSEYRRLSRSR
jgi:tetratricopeptide (TPR) repeat protein